jgi:hypothetical protein
MYKLICLSLILAPSWAAHAQTMPKTLYAVGIGSSSCGYWLSSPDREVEGKIWLWGYWSGLNSSSVENSLIGKDVDGEGIAGEVKKVCDAMPSMPLMQAVSTVYAQFKKNADSPRPQKRKAHRRRR